MTRKNTYSELLDNGYVVGSLSCDTVALISRCDLGSYFSGKEMCLFGDISTKGEVAYDTTRTYRTWGPINKNEDTSLLTIVENDIVKNCPVFSTGKKGRAFVRVQEYQSTYTLIQSVKGVTRQCWHTDYDINQVVQFTSSSTDRFGQIPVVALVALEDGATLSYIPGSHNVLLRGTSYLQEEKLLRLSKGEYVLFHPLLVHRGTSYIEQNRRLHIYFDSLLCPRSTTEEGEALTHPFDFISNSQYALSEKFTTLTKDVRAKLVRDAKAKSRNKRFKK